MNEIEYDEWMSESDAILWHLDSDPLLRATMASVWILDSMPDRDRLDTAIKRMVQRLPRLGQRVVDDPIGIATPRWENDPRFDLSYHYRWVRLPGEAPTRSDLLDHAQHLTGRSFDRARPLWEMNVIEGLPDGAGAFVLIVHHAIADGLGMVNMLSHLVDLERDGDDGSTNEDLSFVDQSEADKLSAPSIAKSARRRIRTEAGTGFRFGKASIKWASNLVANPFGTARSTVKTTASVANVVKPTPTPLSELLMGRSTSPVFSTLVVPLERLKAAARPSGGTINDAFVSAVLDGLGRYHREHDSDCDEIRMMMPVSVRTVENAAKATNQFVPTRMVLPIAAADADARLADTRAKLIEVRSEPALPHMNEISALIGRLGPNASVKLIGDMMKGTDVTTTNVPGPPFPVFMAGTRVEEFYGYGPPSGGAANITLFSYNGLAHFGITTDSAAIDDPDVFVRCIEAGLEEVLSLASE